MIFIFYFCLRMHPEFLIHLKKNKALLAKVNNIFQYPNWKTLFKIVLHKIISVDHMNVIENMTVANYQLVCFLHQARQVRLGYFKYWIAPQGIGIVGGKQKLVLVHLSNYNYNIIGIQLMKAHVIPGTWYTVGMSNYNYNNIIYS